jgi:putative addiction module killer protein
VVADQLLARIDRAGSGNLGDCKPVGEGVSEMRIDYGPGYRVYFLQRGAEVVILLVGGGKATQAKDIECAKELAKQV